MSLFANVGNYNKYKFSTTSSNYFVNVKKYLLLNEQTALEYYRNKVDTIPNNILKNIINDLYYNTTDVTEYIFKINNRKIYVLRNHGVVTEGYKGKVLEDVFFRNSREVLMDKDNGLHIEELEYLEKNWESINALTCISHCYLDTRFHSLNNKLEYIDKDDNKEDKDLKENISIFTLDVVKLMIQFRFYRDNAIRLDRIVSIPEFLYRYVYPNASKGLMNITLMNYYMANNSDLEFGKVKQKDRTPILLLNNESAFNDYMDKISAEFRKMHKGKAYQLLLSKMLLLNSNGLKFAVDEIENLEYSIINRWAVNLARIKIIYFCITFMGPNGIRFNRDFITELKINLKRFERDKGYIPEEIVGYYKSYVDKIQKYLGETK